MISMPSPESETLLPVEEIQKRLSGIYPEGAPERNYCTREMAASTVFVMLYVGAVEGSDIWIRPDQVTRMTDEQAQRTSVSERQRWYWESLKPRKGEISGAWYATNTREPIRDETICQGLVPTGAVIKRGGVPTTSPKPVYALTSSFAGLFAADLSEAHLTNAIASWQERNLSPQMLARLRLAAGAGTQDEIVVQFPNHETRLMPPGPSSVISKAVIESFAPRYLAHPSVLWLSDSKQKVVERDDKLARLIGIKIDQQKHLPDLILADVEKGQFLLVFVEVVATDGPITEERRGALFEMARAAGLGASDVAFVTAYSDRGAASFRKTVGSVAAGSAIWFMSEPECLLVRLGGRGNKRSVTS
jgi:hypothetical protein